MCKGNLQIYIRSPHVVDKIENLWDLHASRLDPCNGGWLIKCKDAWFSFEFVRGKQTELTRLNDNEMKKLFIIFPPPRRASLSWVERKRKLVFLRSTSDADQHPDQLEIESEKICEWCFGNHLLHIYMTVFFVCL